MGLFDAGIGNKVEEVMDVIKELVVQVTILNHKVGDLNENMSVLTENLEEILSKIKKGK